ncbi:MAG TPA: carboxypeptidase regulatory-like domain-containing protein [Candidatus Sulfotelmatobacter sp.]|nr:carboxypeptidase regulatory-like domain-containing protein [Candidatus Sulfotelmatobacter sp.]
MKKRFAILFITVLVAGLCVPAVFAQASGTVKGTCKDTEGNPVADALVVFANQDNGQKYTLKTNKKGEYFSLGLTPGKYNVTLYKNADEMKAGKQLDIVKGFPVQLDENVLDFDAKKSQEAAAKGQGMTPEQLKQLQEQQAKAQKETTTVKSLNEKLSAAKASADAGDFDTAIATLNEANQVDPSRDLLWFKLGDYYRMSATKQTDPAEKQKRFGSAVESYQKAIQLKQATPDKDPAKQASTLAAYYNNLAEAYAKSNKIDDAVKTYELAAQTEPTSAAQYYFNTGAVLTNAGKVDDAIVAFDKVIAADPNRADAYYWKGVNLIGKATLEKSGKMTAPSGTAEAFQKYLELQPTGTYADPAKQMLAQIGGTVETSFGKKKPAPKK